MDFEVIDVETDFGLVKIRYDYYNYRPIVVLDVDGVFESASYLDDKFALIFEYMKLFNLMFDDNYNKVINDVLLIGGGCFSYPKYYLKNYKGKIDVVEINNKLFDIARDYFFLDEILDDRLHCYFMDGREYLDYNKKKYDVIVCDAFIGDKMLKKMHSIEAMKRVKESLNDRGMYICNVISSLTGKDSKMLIDIVKTLQCCFGYIYVFKAKETDSNDLKQNVIVVAVDENINFNIISKDNIHPVKQHQFMINHLTDLNLKNAFMIND